MEHVDLRRFFQNTINHAVDMRLGAVEELPDVAVFHGRRAAVGEPAPIQSQISARSRWARGVSLTRYAMGGFEVGEEFLGIASLPLSGLFESLANSFASIGAGGNIEQSLVGAACLYWSIFPGAGGGEGRASGVRRRVKSPVWPGTKGPSSGSFDTIVMKPRLARLRRMR